MEQDVGTVSESNTPSRYVTRRKVYAKTYSEAIETFGSDMDALWENGNWSLLSCEVEPVAYDGCGRPLAWRWDIEGEWHGQRSMN